MLLKPFLMYSENLRVVSVVMYVENYGNVLYVHSSPVFNY